MRSYVAAVFAFAALVAAPPASAQTYAPGFPVCLHVFFPLAYYDCRYDSIAQCNQSASGRAAQCVTNPYFADGTTPRARRAHRAY